MEDVLRAVIGICAVVAAILAFGLWYESSIWNSAQTICAAQGMEAIDIKQGSGKWQHSAYLCRAPNGQLYSF